MRKPPNAEGIPQESRRSRIRRRLKRTLDRVWGPAGSAGLHLLIILLLARFVTGSVERSPPHIRVTLPDGEEISIEDPPPTNPPDRPFPEAPPIAVYLPDEPPLAPELPPGGAPADFAALDVRSDVRIPWTWRTAYGHRTAEGRNRAGERYAPKTHPAGEVSVLKALDWLKSRQEPEGSWRDDTEHGNRTAMTGLALLTFLAHGERPDSGEPYGPVVERAIRFLSETDLQGDRFRNADAHLYGHGIAAYALSEAYGLTRIHSVKEAAERAVARIVRGQQATGAFNYGLRAGDTRRDTSVMGWMTQAMKAAYIAGLDVPGLREAMERAADGFRLNHDASSRMFAYAPDGAPGASAGRPSNTCMAVLCLQLIGEGGSPETREGFDVIRGLSSDYRRPAGLGNYPMYVWYYANQAFFHTAGSAWSAWHPAFARSTVASQNSDGSWTPVHGNETRYGPVYGTAFSALSLMVYYRILPTYQPIVIEDRPDGEGEDDVRIEITAAIAR
jgi:hypothetical protein